MRSPFIPCLFVAAIAGGACSEPADKAQPEPTVRQISNKPRAAAATSKDATPEPDLAKVKHVFGTLPAVFESKDNPITEEKITLGRQLFFDTRFSKNHDQSCNTCHGLDTFGVDNLKVSKGHKGQEGARNSPTVYNAAGHFAQFWDGREPDVESQAKGPVLNPVEMAMPGEEFVVKTLKSIPGYVDAFKAAFPDDAAPVTFDNMAKAIGAFERKLTTPSRFDQYLEGKADALTAQEKAGLVAFMEVGCTTCHDGPLLGGRTFQKLGVYAPYANTADLGRAEVTKNDADKWMFKVPSLRNVAKTAPYYHDGGVADLPTAVTTMAKLQLDKTLTDEQTANIVAFLNALTGELPTDYIKAPELPESGPKTPKPDPE